jgi:23S rRNA (adenine2503-C2)-methyltransferase
VNVIPLNPTAGFPGRASPPARLRAFADGVRRFGVNTTIRRNRGVDIDAACGQLRTRLAGHSDAAVPTPTGRPARMGP